MANRIHTDRLVLDIVSVLGDFEVARWMAKVPHPFTTADVRITSEEGARQWPEMSAITLEDKVIGSVRVADTIGFWLSRDHWGQGFMSGAAEAAVTALFERSDQDAICSCVFDGNSGSARVLEKLGFEVTTQGTGYCLARNQTLAETSYQLTRTKWEALG